jgi:hypothetical protein
MLAATVTPAAVACRKKLITSSTVTSAAEQHLNAGKNK